MREFILRIKYQKFENIAQEDSFLIEEVINWDSYILVASSFEEAIREFVQPYMDNIKDTIIYGTYANDFLNVKTDFTTEISKIVKLNYVSSIELIELIKVSDDIMPIIENIQKEWLTEAKLIYDDIEIDKKLKEEERFQKIEKEYLELKEKLGK